MAFTTTYGASLGRGKYFLVTEVVSEKQAAFELSTTDAIRAEYAGIPWVQESLMTDKERACVHAAYEFGCKVDQACEQYARQFSRKQFDTTATL